jgi:hypothetical protein
MAATFGGLDHFDLLNHPEPYDQIRAWLTGADGWEQLPRRQRAEAKT